MIVGLVPAMYMPKILYPVSICLIHNGNYLTKQRIVDHWNLLSISSVHLYILSDYMCHIIILQDTSEMNIYYYLPSLAFWLYTPDAKKLRTPTSRINILTCLQAIIAAWN